MNKKKKAILIVFAVMCAVGALSWYLLYGNPDILTNTADKIEDDVIGMYGSTQSYVFYPADEAPDAEAIAEYNGLDRQFYCTRGAETIAVTEEDLGNYGAEIGFLFDYFKTVKAGDYEKYNTLFTENYYKDNEKTCDFTPQMIYDINVEKLSEESSGGENVYICNVSYKIFRNNGTFRNDIGSDGSKTLRFTMVEKSGKVLIDKIEYYV